MNKIIILLWVNLILTAQSKTTSEFNRFREYKIDSVTAKTVKSPEILDIPKVIFSYDTLDVGQYAGNYYSIGMLPLTSFEKPVLLKDTVNDRSLIYSIGMKSEPNTFGSEGFIYSYENGSFNMLYEYDNILNTFYGAADIDNDGIDEMITRSRDGRLYAFEQDSTSGLFINYQFDFAYDTTQNQAYTPTYFDINEDGRANLLYCYGGDDAYPMGIHFLQYDDSLQNLMLIYSDTLSQHDGTGGILKGDFDRDGKPNILYSGVHGNAYIMEHLGNNEYSVIIENLGVPNCYFQQMTDDLNNNGFPELWVGGYFYSSPYGNNHFFWIMESTGDDTYEKIYEIELRYFSTEFNNDIEVVDLENDGISDILVTTETGLLVLNYINEEVSLKEFIEAPKISGEYLNYLNTNLYDFNNDEIPEIIFSGIPSSEFKTIVMKREIPVNIKEDQTEIKRFALNQNYPNPFNPETRISYNLEKEDNVKLEVYNSLGEKVETLVSELQKRGSHEVKFDGSKLSSGIYFYKLSTSEHSQIKKMVLLK